MLKYLSVYSMRQGRSIRKGGQESIEGQKGTGPQRSASSRGRGSSREFLRCLSEVPGRRAGQRQGEALG